MALLVRPSHKFTTQKPAKLGTGEQLSSLTRKRKKSKPVLEPGEIDQADLANKTPMWRRAEDGTMEKVKQPPAPTINNPDRFIGGRRLVDAFNIGDLDLIEDIILEIAVDDCMVEIPTLRKSFCGKGPLIQLWTALFDAYPDGSFRSSDTIMNGNMEVITRFVFTGTKIFHMQFFDSPNGPGFKISPNEDLLRSSKLSRNVFGQLTDAIGAFSCTASALSRAPFCSSSSLSSSSSSQLPSNLEIQAEVGGGNAVTHTHSCNSISLNMPAPVGTVGQGNKRNCNSNTGSNNNSSGSGNNSYNFDNSSILNYNNRLLRPIAASSSKTPHPPVPLHFCTGASIVHELPMISSAELLVLDKPPEVKVIGEIILKYNSQAFVKKFRILWKKVP